jgi:hypothetical protein
MAEKTLGRIAQEAFWNATGPTSADDWEVAVSAAIAEYEARRWKPWETVPRELGDDKLFLAYNIGNKRPYIIWLTYEGWTDGEVDEDGAYTCWPFDTRFFTHWAALPAPPKEGDDADGN